MNVDLVQDDPFATEVLATLRRALTQVLPPDEAARLTDRGLADQISTPPEFKLGQAAFPCFPFARALRKAPPKIAEDVRAAVESVPGRFVARVDAVAGYLNFFADFRLLGHDVLGRIRTGQYFRADLLPKDRREKIVVEYSQPNTHKALHVGHLRNVIFGDAVCNILAYAGHDVVRMTYPGDLGAHIAKVLSFVVRHHAAEVDTRGDADWLGEMYVAADAEVKAAEGTPRAAEIKAETSKVFHDLQARRGPNYDLYRRTREWSLAQMREVYAWLGTHFDQWEFESECDEPSRELVRQKFEEGVFKESQGAIGLDLNEHDLGFALLLKSDGGGLYLTKDVELIRRKFSDPAVTRSIYVVDARQKLHFQQLFKVAEAMGYPHAAKSVHLAYESVTTATGEAFSSRALKGLALSHLRGELERKVKDDYLKQYEGDWPAAEIDDVASKVALGALKYGMLRMDPMSQIKFILEEWLRLDGDTGPYLQYTHVRCRAVIEKSGGLPPPPAEFAFESPLEPELIMTLGKFNEVMANAAREYRPNVLTSYLFDLCKAFNRFYKECRIKDAPEPFRTNRLHLVDATVAVLKQGLTALGIPTPSRM